MKIFNQDKTIELNDIDLTKGYLKYDRLLIAHHPAVEKKIIKSASEIADELKTQGKLVNLRSDGNWYVATKIYKSGGMDEELIEAVVEKGIEAYDEFEDIQIYVLYTEKELAEKQIAELKQKLANTDYQAIKYAEGLITELDYAEIKQQRQAWRDEINKLEDIINEVTK